MLQNPKVFDDVAETLLPEIYARARAVAAQRGATATI